MLRGKTEFKEQCLQSLENPNFYRTVEIIIIKNYSNNENAKYNFENEINKGLPVAFVLIQGNDQNNSLF